MFSCRWCHRIINIACTFFYDELQKLLHITHKQNTSKNMCRKVRVILFRSFYFLHIIHVLMFSLYFNRRHIETYTRNASLRKSVRLLLVYFDKLKRIFYVKVSHYFICQNKRRIFMIAFTYGGEETVLYVLNIARNSGRKNSFS